MLIIKFWSNLTKVLKLKSIYLVFLSIIATILETISIGLLIPIIVTITGENIFEKFNFLKEVNIILGNPSKTELAFITISIFTAVYIFKSMFLIYNTYAQGKFIYTTNEHITKLLFKKYITEDLNFFINFNTHQMVERIKTDIAHCMNSLNSFLSILSELFIIIGITSFLFYMEPFGFLIILGFTILASFIYYFIITKKIKIIGKKRQISDEHRTKSLLEGFGGIREIKAFGIENTVIHNFNLMSKPRIDFFTKWHVIRNLPKMFFEIIIVTAAAFLAYFLIFGQGGLERTLIVLGIFVAASFRILPSLNRVLVGLQGINYGYYSTKLVIDSLGTDNINKSENIKSKITEFKQNISLKDVTFSHQDRNSKIFENLNFKIKKGEFVAIMGETGSGKSTLADLLLGFQKPSQGQLFLDDLALKNGSILDFIGYVPQNVYLFNTTIKENIAPGIPNNQIDINLINKCIDICELKNFLDSNNLGLEANVGEKGFKLSGGEKQRIGLARALYKKPKILLLDEATNALDETTEENIYKKIFDKKNKITIVSIIHKQSLRKYFDRVVQVSDKSVTEL